MFKQMFKFEMKRHSIVAYIFTTLLGEEVSDTDWKYINSALLWLKKLYSDIPPSDDDHIKPLVCDLIAVAIL